MNSQRSICLLKRATPLTDGGHRNEAHSGQRAQGKACPRASVAPGSRGPPRRKRWGEGGEERLVGSPSPPPRAPPSSLAQSCLRGRRFPREAQRPLCTHPCLLQLPPWGSCRGDLVSGPLRSPAGRTRGGWPCAEIG